MDDVDIVRIDPCFDHQPITRRDNIHPRRSRANDPADRVNLEADDKELMRPDIGGRPVYLGLAMTADNLLRLKPQNILTNLPLADTA